MWIHTGRDFYMRITRIFHKTPFGCIVLCNFSADIGISGEANHYQERIDDLSIASEISRINGNIADAYTACDEKGASMPLTRNSANLADTIESIRSGGAVTIINEETVPESVNWDDDIPETYGGETGEIGELALYLETLWYLSDVIDVQGVSHYAWYAVATVTDLSYKMDYAHNYSSDAAINALHEGQVFTTDSTVGVKSAAAGTAGDKQAYTTEYADNHFLAPSQFAQSTISNSLPEQDIAVHGKKVGEHFIGPNMEIYEVTQTGSWGCHINKLQQSRDKVSTLSASSTNAQYPGAKCVYDALAAKADVSDIPTKTSDLTNDSGFLTQHQNISGKENTSNKVTSLSSSSTNTQYPSAKCVYDYISKNNFTGVYDSDTGEITFEGMSETNILKKAVQGNCNFPVLNYPDEGSTAILHLDFWNDGHFYYAHIYLDMADMHDFEGSSQGDDFAFIEL